MRTAVAGKRTDAPGERRARAAALGAALLVVAIAHAGALGAALVWDDHHLLGPQGSATRAENWTQLFSMRFWEMGSDAAPAEEYYRPLTLTSFRMQLALGAGSAWLHAGNLLLHLCACALLFACALRFGATPRAAALASALFGTLPRLTESVTIVSGRTDLLASVGALGALALHSSAPGAHARRWAAAALLLAGLLGKEVALAGAVAIAALEWAQRSGSLSRAARNLIPVACAVATFALLRLAAQVPAAAQSPFALADRALFGLQALGAYAGMIALPASPQLVIGSVGWTDPLHLAVGAVVALGLAAGIAALLAGRVPARHAAWLALAIAALLPVLHVVPISVRSIAADRFLYLPLAGAAIGLALGLPRLDVGRGRMLAAGLALAVLGLGATTAARTRDFRDERVLWEKEVRRAHPGNGQAHFELANQRAWRGDARGALTLYAESLRRERALQERFPRWSVPVLLRANTGLVLSELGRFDEAVPLLAEVVAAEPSVTSHHLYLGTALSRALRFAEADAALSRALALDPGYRSAAQARARNRRAQALWAALPPEREGEPAALRARRAQVYQWVGHLERAATLWIDVARAEDADAEALSAAERALAQQRQVFGETPATRALASALAERRS